MKASPALIAELFPFRWRASQRCEADGYEWTEQEFLEALQSLKTQPKSSAKLKSCFFIDGLDEYEGDHAWIAKFLKDLVALPHFKICVSSRPWIIFQDAFGSSATMLRVQDMTVQDIERYTQSELESHPRYAKLQEREPNRAPELLAEVSGKASGVFLWIFLVVRSLKEGLTNGDRISDLQRRVDQLPGDLEEYFSHILNSVSAFYFDQAAEFFFYALDSKNSLTLHTYSFCQEEDLDFGLKMPTRSISITEAEVICDETERRLISRCKGLLEVYGHMSNSALTDSRDEKGQEQYRKVGFLHRTVRDFLRAPEVISKLEAPGIPLKPERSRVLLQATVAQFKSLRQTPRTMASIETISLLIGQAVPSLKTFGKTSYLPETVLIDAFDQSISYWWNNTAKYKYNDRNYVHWTDFWMRRDGLHSFLSFAVAFGLKAYVRDKLKSNTIYCSKQTLFKYTLFPQTLVEMTLAPDIDMIKLLLEEGVEPRYVDEALAIWQKHPRKKRSQAIIDFLQPYAVWTSTTDATYPSESAGPLISKQHRKYRQRAPLPVSAYEISKAGGTGYFDDPWSEISGEHGLDKPHRNVVVAKRRYAFSTSGSRARDAETLDSLEDAMNSNYRQGFT